MSSCRLTPGALAATVAMRAAWAASAARTVTSRRSGSTEASWAGVSTTSAPAARTSSTSRSNASSSPTTRRTWVWETVGRGCGSWGSLTAPGGYRPVLVGLNPDQLGGLDLEAHRVAVVHRHHDPAGQLAERRLRPRLHPDLAEV